MELPVAFVGSEPEFAAAMDKVTAMSKKYCKALVGVALGPPMVEERLRQGFTVLVNSVDLFALAFGTITDLGTARATIEGYMGKSEA
jgi:hypothetical protein